ncbi:MAG: TSUP family transporter [Phycisphaerae bacterium]|nr:TSUP family transporter [Phycisphaerae bacterium]
MELTFITYMLLWLTAFLAGFVDSIAGGGGIITIPVFLALGFDPHIALGTNKLQASFGSLTASVHYARSGLVDVKQTIEGVIFTAIGAAAGTYSVQLIDSSFLKHIILPMLGFVFVYMLFSPDLGAMDKKPRVKTIPFYIVAGLTIGFYDEFFGPGTGSFWAVGFIFLLGYNLKKATAHTKIMNFTSNIISLTAFIIGGNVLFIPGIIMGTGQLVGATIGSHLVIRKGTKFIRFFFLAVVAVTIAKLIYSTYIK